MESVSNLVTDKLEDERYVVKLDLCPQQIVVVVFELRISKMVPPFIYISAQITRYSRRKRGVRASIPIQQRWRLDSLLSILAPLALECVVCLR